MKNSKKDEKTIITKEEYIKNIIDMVNKIENLYYLEFICNMMISFKKKWGI